MIHNLVINGSDVFDGSLLSPIELILVILAIGRAGASVGVKNMAGGLGQIIHGDFIVVWQGPTKREASSICKRRWNAGKALPKPSLRIIKLGVTARNEFAFPNVGCLLG